MAAKVIPLNNITRLDIPVDRVLEDTKGRLKDIVILGYDNDGEEYFASSIADGAEVNWLLDRCKLQLHDFMDEE